MTTVDESKLDYWRKANEARSREPEVQRELPLKGGNGGGTSDDMIPIKDYVDSRDDAIESRLTAKLDTLATKDSTRNNIWGAVAVTLGVLIGLMAFAGDRFDSGLDLSPRLASYQTNQASVDQRQDERLRQMDNKLDVIVKQTKK